MAWSMIWALREYPTSTDEQAILRHLGEMDGVTIRIYTRQVTPSEERRIIHNAANKHRMSRSSTEDLQQTVTAEANLQDVVTLVSSMHRNREPLLHCAVFLELTAPDYDALKLLQTDVLTELVRSKLNVDRLMLRQQEGFVSVMPAGRNAFGAQFERVLPASSVANLYPFNYSGKTDPHGFYIGKDKYGANILVDFDKRDDDKTSANILILGNSGQGKSYLLKLLLLNFLEAGKSVISLDVEHEQKDMCETVGGCFMDLMGGVYRINPLEPKCWDDGSGPEARDAPEAFRKSTRLSQHISFLKDFFRAYKDFSDRHIDAIEIMVGKLYAKWGISDSTNFAGLKPQDYPILSDLYKLIEQEYREYDGNCHQLYTAELLQEILLGLHSMCQGAEAQFFNGHTNVTSSRFIVFGVKGLLQASKNVRGAMLFNILSYMSDRLLTIGNTTAALDELYVWLSDNVSVGTTIIEYIRNTLKRVRKKESNLIMASQNLEDFDREGIRELTKPLFAIPPHQFIFNCGSIDKRFYMDLLQLEEAEYNLIRFPQRGVCLFKCGNERYLLEVHAPAYTLSKGIKYNKNDVVIELFKDTGCTDKITTWDENSGKFTVTYDDTANTMSIHMTEAGLTEINEAATVYTDSVKRGYSDCTMRITYAATLTADAQMGDKDNPNEVVLTWKRTNTTYFDTLNDCCHVYTYGINVLKQFSDNGGKVQNVKFLLHNDTDDCYIIADLKDGVYYAKGFAAKKADATTFVPNVQGHVVVKGLEDDTYSLTETTTDKGYILLKEAVKIVITTKENGACEQCGAKLLTAAGTVNGKTVSMTDGNAIVPLTVVNNPGFDLPKTGGYGTWMFTIGGVALLGAAAFIVVKSRKRNEQ